MEAGGERAAVADLVEVWLDAPDVKWELSRDVVAWVADYGDDVARAWAECPRGDHLLALAAVGGAAPDAVLRVACRAARAALAFVPGREPAPTRAVWLAESWRRGRLPRGHEAIERAAWAVFDRLEARERDLARARAALVPRWDAAVQRVVGGVFDAGLAQAEARGVAPPDLPERIAAVAVAALAQAFRQDRDLRALREDYRERHALLATAHAARAAASCVTVAGSIDIAALALAFDRVPDASDGRRAEAARIARRSGARVFTESARALDHVAQAHGEAEAASDAAWENALGAALDVLLAATLAKSDHRGAMHEALVATLDARRDHAVAARHRALADAVRAEIPWPSLAFDAPA